MWKLIAIQLKRQNIALIRQSKEIWALKDMLFLILFCKGCQIGFILEHIALIGHIQAFLVQNLLVFRLEIVWSVLFKQIEVTYLGRSDTQFLKHRVVFDQDKLEVVILSEGSANMEFLDFWLDALIGWGVILDKDKFVIFIDFQDLVHEAFGKFWIDLVDFFEIGIDKHRIIGKSHIVSIINKSNE